MRKTNTDLLPSCLTLILMGLTKGFHINQGHGYRGSQLQLFGFRIDAGEISASVYALQRMPSYVWPNKLVIRIVHLFRAVQQPPRN